VPRIGFVLEQTLGHITHTQNLRALAAEGVPFEPAFAPVAYDVTGLPAKIPGYGNWTIRAGLRARSAVRDLKKGGPLDALFVHTQVPAILLPDVLRRLPTVVSLDATPQQYDELGAHYDHATQSRPVENVKWRLNRQCFARAKAVVTWAQWTKDALVAHYDVPADKITVIPPGVRVDQWTIDRPAPEAGAAVRVLFVGGNLERKGGPELLEAVRRLRADGTAVELDLVTQDDASDEPGITVHRGLRPNTPELIALYRRADVFCLPTRGDCLPMVLSEAGAAGLPLVSTDVGAIDEIVRDHETGLLVPVGDAAALATALGELAGDPALRARLGAGATALVRRDFDAATNARRLFDLLARVAA
jgi:glycosyltransferase involved in cell wall biosynthesis